jgi:hypothetical protein
VGRLLSDRWIAFAVALAVRCVVAVLFFGSVDVANSIADAEELMRGKRASELTAPYLPGVHAAIWTARKLAQTLPAGFAFKFAGCLFDAAIAAAIADARGRRAGLLYALAPVPVLVFAVHGQWDSLSLAPFVCAMLLLRRDGNRVAAGAGALAVLSVIAKPITAPFLMFLIERRRIVPLLGGGIAALAVYAAVLWMIGEPLGIGTLDWIVRYAGGGVQYFGLPVGLGYRANRLLLLLPLLALVPLYAKGRLQREHAVAIACAWILGTCGLGAQYLAWLPPLLLLYGHERFAALYGLAAGAFLTLFYISGDLEIVGGALAPFRDFAWLAPARTNGALLGVLGNSIVPAVCLAYLVWRRKTTEVRTASLAPLGAAYAVLAVLFVVATRIEVSPLRLDAYAAGAGTSRLVPAIACLWIATWSVIAARGAAAGDR